MSRKEENSAFVCAKCGAEVPPLTNGSYRNHCPRCLYSLHVDNVPGDRKSGCGGLMRPVAAVYSGRKGWQIVHKCEKCGIEHRCKLAQNTDMPDDIDVFAKL